MFAGVGMPRVVLVRHGEAEWEVGGRLMGRRDIDLSQRGIAQAARLEERLPELDITAIVSSPLRRALHTADLIGRALTLTPHSHEGLTDLDFGAWTGQTPDDLMRHQPAAYTAWLDRPRTVDLPGGESLSDLRLRVQETLEDILAAHPEEANLLIVTHEHVARSLLTFLLGLGPEHHWQIDLAAGALSVFERRAGMFYLTLLNETCHLADADTPHLFLPHQ